MCDRTIDIAIMNEVSAAVPPPIRGYTYYQARDDRPFRGTMIYVKSNWVSMITSGVET